MLLHWANLQQEDTAVSPRCSTFPLPKSFFDRHKVPYALFYISSPPLKSIIFIEKGEKHRGSLWFKTSPLVILGCGPTVLQPATHWTVCYHMFKVLYRCHGEKLTKSLQYQVESGQEKRQHSSSQCNEEMRPHSSGPTPGSLPEGHTRAPQ